MCFVPISARANIDPQWDTQFAGRGHALTYCGSDTLGSVRADLEYQFVMDLHDKTRGGVLSLTPGVHADHRPF